MSYGGYNQYGGNPYEQEEAANPYGQLSPYAAQVRRIPLEQQPPPLTHQQASNYSQPSQYSDIPMADLGTASQSPHISSDTPFYTRVSECRKNIDLLEPSLKKFATLQNRVLFDANEAEAQTELKKLTDKIADHNKQIKDEIKSLEMLSGNNKDMNVQIRTLRNSFRKKLDDYMVLQQEYSNRCREQFMRQYLIIKPDATDEEVEDAANEVGNKSGGLFQEALKSNRSGQANSVLGAVRARHNDIQQIEKAMIELAQLMEQLNEAVVFQDNQVTQTEQKTEDVLEEGRQANVQLDKGVEHIRRRNRLRCWTLFIFILIVCIIALVIGLYFGLKKKNDDNNNNP
ncbi:t-SNARE [Phyllosticta citrichinensis]|uniref:t-SNARE n=1 Tax=Phyllosticta citrichinensis TaxID=1130410 RepID=A0ABR1XH10_9PEZI